MATAAFYGCWNLLMGKGYSLRGRGHKDPTPTMGLCWLVQTREALCGAAHPKVGTEYSSESHHWSHPLPGPKPPFFHKVMPPIPPPPQIYLPLAGAAGALADRLPSTEVQS